MMRTHAFHCLLAGSLSALLLMTSCSDFLTAWSQDLIVPSKVSDLDELLLGDVYMGSSIRTNGPSGKSSCGFFNMLDDDFNIGYSGAAAGKAWNGCIEGNFGYIAWQQNVGINYAGNITADDAATWDDLYARINVVNVILDKIQHLPHDTEDDFADWQRVQGEALFERAFFYFVLANLYGKPYTTESADTCLAVPLKLTPYVEHDKEKDTQFDRATVQSVYEQILTDLHSAETYLTESPQNSAHRKYRASLESVQLLLSRVYLYMQRWEEARLYSEKLIGDGPFSLIPLSKVGTGTYLTDDNSEFIFSQGSNYLSTHDVFTALLGDFCVAKSFYDTFSKNDRRKTTFFDVAVNDSIRLTDKYPRGDIRCRVSDALAMRLSEAYLNGAEASAMMGDYASACQRLNELRHERIDSIADGYWEGAELIDTIRAERRRELCFEGHRWFDLRRYCVNELYPESHPILRVINACNTSTMYYLTTVMYQLEPFDDAYTFAIPKKVLEFDKKSMPTNPRPLREPLTPDGEGGKIDWGTDSIANNP